MSGNFLITGSPGSGKTTVVENVLSSLREKGFEVGGVYCPEIRSGGVRRGFEIIDIMTGESKILAHVDQDQGPRVSKYRVNVPNVGAISKSAISRALEEADLLVIDEIAPMETYSDEFRRQVRRALDSEKPLIAVVHKRSKSGFIGEVKRREDSKLFEVTERTRNSLPGKVEELVLEGLR
ncbi:hypothetical protein AKJ63_01680 [candidate division MSBL1 archaeon SCGC-AAA259D18]|uniref:Nucleoside-triphosphatase AKJ63_01680 n=1 Tax=candidate division MSBL1 archaeon SCGC-AAA259D18 TaxID=1698262 RepID=A0A133UAT7_9EURY|nr:hypothetical protein AKJ63_01680 [candidate division MSBL1 archaeon SCGC-AAA259D18]